MKRNIFYLLFIPMLAACSLETFNTPRDLNYRIGEVEIHRCFCDSSTYRYLIVTKDRNDTLRYNPINLPKDFKDDNYKIVFSADLLNDSSIVYTNTPTSEVVTNFKVRNIKLYYIRKCSNLVFNDTMDLVYGKTYRNYERSISIKLDSVMEDSRCPYNVECIWAGNAKAKFVFGLNNQLKVFSLNTLDSFMRDTIISDYKIQFIQLRPYPVYPNPIHQKDYIARIKITR